MIVVNNYKKVFVIGLALVMFLAFYIYYIYMSNINKPITQVTILGDYMSYSNADDLEKNADLIIVGTPLKEFSECTPTITYNEFGRYDNFYTVSDIRISKILKGQYQSDTIPVLQNAAIDKKENIMLVDEGYSVMKKGKKYLLFLKKSPLEGYYILGINEGKHSVDNSDVKEKEVAENDSHYKDIKQEVLKKYSDKLAN
ncbi:MAG: hypothetical protein C4589_00370 [Peptococcaceae bacterium]|nr:MAG: hypothetical protein C4589_00370 [Peptococcaceae bacterium]